MKNKNSKNIKGITLIEILIGIVVSSIMMGAMYTTYSAVNNTYNQVTDRAKIRLVDYHAARRQSQGG